VKSLSCDQKVIFLSEAVRRSVAVSKTSNTSTQRFFAFLAVNQKLCDFLCVIAPLRLLSKPLKPFIDAGISGGYQQEFQFINNILPIFAEHLAQCAFRFIFAPRKIHI